MTSVQLVNDANQRRAPSVIHGIVAAFASGSNSGVGRMVVCIICVVELVVMSRVRRGVVVGACVVRGWVVVRTVVESGGLLDVRVVIVVARTVFMAGGGLVVGGDSGETLVLTTE